MRIDSVIRPLTCFMKAGKNDQCSGWGNLQEQARGSGETPGTEIGLPVASPPGLSALRSRWALPAALALGAAVLSQFMSDGHSHKLQLVHSFGPDAGASGPAGCLAKVHDDVFATCSTGGSWDKGAVIGVNPKTGSSWVLHSFRGRPADGASANGGLVRGRGDALFGTTPSGGEWDLGTVFTIRPEGTGYQVLHHFGGKDGDGQNALGALVVGVGGELYGTTFGGGKTAQGTVFRVEPDGSGYRTLHSFDDSRGNGLGPHAGLCLGPDGDLYGTTVYGGPGGNGTVYRLSNDGSNFQVLHTFDPDGRDGANPYGGLLLGASGQLFGTTTAGGRTGLGTIFRLDLDGGNCQVIRHLSLADGGFAYAGLAQDTRGVLYGMCIGGGELEGTLFRLAPNGGRFSVLHRFDNSSEIGYLLKATPLVTDSEILGITQEGGRGGSGGLFRFALKRQTSVRPMHVGEQ